jgi:membrane protein required for beta-lactamase induction
MTLIAILLALATERYWHPFSSYKVFSPLLSWHDFLASRYRQMAWFDGAAGALLTVAPVMLIVMFLQYGLAGTNWFFMWMIKLVFSFVVLVACIGEQRFGVHVRKYLEFVSSGDNAGACAYINRISGRDIGAERLRQINRNFIGLLSCA